MSKGGSRFEPNLRSGGLTGPAAVRPFNDLTRTSLLSNGDVRTMQGRLLAIALMAVLLVLPAARACTLTEEPSEPAAVWVWDPEEGREWRTHVENRSLGATCELVNPKAFDGRRLAVQDGSTHVIDLVNDTDLWAETREYPDEIGLTGTQLVYAWDQGPGNGDEVRVRDLRSGRDRAILSAESVVRIAHGRVLTEDRSADSFGVYDVAAGRWIATEIQIDNVSKDQYVSAIAFGERWLVLNVYGGEENRNDHYAVRLPSGERRRVDVVPRPTGTWMDGDWLYWTQDHRNAIVDRVHIPTGTIIENVSKPPYGRPDGVVDRYLLYSAYSEPATEGELGWSFRVRDPAPGPTSEPASTPALAVGAVAATVAAVALHRRSSED